MEGRSLVMPLPPMLRCSSWCAEMLFPVIGSVQIYTSIFLAAIFGELMYYHGVIIIPILLSISGFLGNFAGFTVNYERFAKTKQSRRLMTCVAFITISNACICYYYLFFYVSKEMRLVNMCKYFDDPHVKKMIDLTQQTLECCGDLSYTDWFRVDWQGTDIEPWHSFPPNGILTRSAVPFSCCAVGAPSPCTNNYMNLDNGKRLYRQGCRQALTEKFQLMTLIQGTALLITGLLQVNWLLCFQPPTLATDVENGADDDDGKKVHLDIEVEIDLDDELTDNNSQTALLSPDLATDTDLDPNLPSKKNGINPAPDRFETLVDVGDGDTTDASAKDGDNKSAVAESTDEPSRAEDTEKAIDEEFDMLRSHEEPAKSGGPQQAPEESTDESAAEWLMNEAQIGKNEPKEKSEDNAQDNTVPAAAPEEETGEMAAESPQPPT